MFKEPLLEPEPENEWEGLQPEQVLSDEKITDKNDGDYIATQQEVCVALKSAYQKDKNLQIRLLSYLQTKIYDRTGNTSINGMNSEDFLSITISKILTCTRKWKSNMVPNIVHLILMAAISEIRHESEKIQRLDKYEDPYILTECDSKTEEVLNDKKKRIRYKPRIIPLFETDNEGREKENSIADEYEAKNNITKYNEQYDEEEGFEELVSVIVKELDDDLVTFCVLEERLNGVRSNIEIAKNLGIKVREVENSLKKIKRLFFKLLNKRRL